METLAVVLPGPRGWSMRHGHRHHLEECSGRNGFAKSVARRPRDDKEEKVDCLDARSSKARNTKNRKNDKSRLAYRSLELHRHVEGLGASAEAIDEAQWWKEEDRAQASLRLTSFAVAPISSAEETAFLQMALQESEEEANLQRAIQESLRQSPASPESADFKTAREPADLKKAPEPADRQQGRPERLRLLRQRSAPCIASEFTAAETRMAYVHVPLTAWPSSRQNAMGIGGATPTETHWEQAVERAARAAKEYVFVAGERRKPVKPPDTVAVPTANAVEAYPRVPIRGRPPAPSQHQRVLELAMPTHRRKYRDYPACWEDVGGRHTKVQLPRVNPSSEEYHAVTDYFNATVGRYGRIEVKELIRLQNPWAYDRYDPGFASTVMFHGCRSQANEDSIIADGFRVSCCKSGGHRFGTWFAYSASYSNNCGFVFVDGQEIRHLFVCVVSSKHVVLDDDERRVVGEGCAYPLWLLKYKQGTWNVRPWKAAKGSSRKAAPKSFHVVRGGSWVLE